MTEPSERCPDREKNEEQEVVFMEKDTTIGTQKLAALFDAGTFAEIGAYVRRSDGKNSGAVCGYGAVGGKLVYAFAQDSDREKGAFDLTTAKKLHMLYETAMRNGAPVVGIFDSIGAYMTDGADAMAAYGSLLADVSRASGVIPQIALIDGVCAGLSATAAAMFDLTVTVAEKSRLFVGAPFLTGKDGGSDSAAADGLSSVTAKDGQDALEKVRTLLGLLPSSCAALPEEIGNDDLNRTVQIGGLAVRDMIASLADGGSFVEIGGKFGAGMVTGLAMLGGYPCGVVANDAAVAGGVLTADGARKAAKLVSLCNCFGLPVVTLVDSEGVAVNAKEESAPLAAELGKLAMIYAAANVAKITVITGKAYGAAFTLMGSKALGADLVYALDGATVSVMKPEAAVAFLWNDRITETVTRAELVKKWTDEEASAVRAAESGAVDDILNPADLRKYLCGAVNMLLCKDEATLTRKHCNLPL